MLISAAQKHFCVPHMPVITPAPATKTLRPEDSIATMLLSGRNKHGDSTCPDELCQKKLYYTIKTHIGDGHRDVFLDAFRSVDLFICDGFPLTIM
ncbi:jg19177 [Pararge aegeria aegeria]|uniref:Jg19177 protein n=1 Tax=Pararge aegeria aegeria TaxID=348720 RepID=A0A8S4QIQ8_9NEOP|nr:jg19177 [Pararge aegeria aegeria]